MPTVKQILYITQFETNITIVEDDIYYKFTYGQSPKIDSDLLCRQVKSIRVKNNTLILFV